MRLFFAIDFPDYLKTRLADNIEILRQFMPKGIKWVDQKNLHVTFKFLGDVNERILEDVYESVKKVTDRHAPFTISFTQAEMIPNPENPRLIWYDMSDDQHAASKLFGDIERTLYDLGFHKEKRPLALHTTLGRIKFVRNIPWTAILPQLKIIDAIVDCNELTLFKSTLTPSGPIYSILKKFPFNNTEKNGGTI